MRVNESLLWLGGPVLPVNSCPLPPIAILSSLFHNTEPTPSYGPLLLQPPYPLASASFLRDVVCIRPNYTLSFLRFISAVSYAWDSYRTMN